MTEPPRCNSEYEKEFVCELRKGYKGYHKFTKYWSQVYD